MAELQFSFSRFHRFIHNGQDIVNAFKKGLKSTHKVKTMKICVWRHFSVQLRYPEGNRVGNEFQTEGSSYWNRVLMLFFSRVPRRNLWKENTRQEKKSGSKKSSANSLMWGNSFELAWRAIGSVHRMFWLTFLFGQCRVKATSCPCP